MKTSLDSKTLITGNLAKALHSKHSCMTHFSKHTRTKNHNTRV